MTPLRDRVQAEVAKVVLGQEQAVDRLLVALFAGGHVLLEGVPGVAKTLLANATARAVGLPFRRAQFTPDMLPSDLTGTMIYRDGELSFRPGPVFTNVLLADEINRTPPKTQAALLEAMEERQVTVEGEPHALPDPFLVVGTQNPIEYEGTYPLPEAQLDRFLFKLAIGYPDEQVERSLLELRHRGVAPATLTTCSPWRASRSCARRSARSTRPASATRSSPTWPRSCARPARCRASSWVQARAPRCTCSRRRRARRGSRSAGSSRPTTSRALRTTSSGTG